MIDKIKASGNHVLIIRDEAASEKNGLIVPDNAKKKPNMGKIISVGSLVMDKTIKQGKIAVFNANVGQVLTFPDGDITYLRETELIGTI